MLTHKKPRALLMVHFGAPAVMLLFSTTCTHRKLSCCLWVEHTGHHQAGMHDFEMHSQRDLLPAACMLVFFVLEYTWPNISSCALSLDFPRPHSPISIYLNRAITVRHQWSAVLTEGSQKTIRVSAEHCTRCLKNLWLSM